MHLSVQVSRLLTTSSGLLGGSDGKRLPAMREIRVWSLSQEDPLDKEMATVQYSCLENSMDRGAL